MTEAEKKPLVHWSPAWAKHVKGWHEERRFDSETRQPEPTPCGATCDTCGDTFRMMCLSGLFRQRIANFALLHTHTKPLAVKKS